MGEADKLVEVFEDEIELIEELVEFENTVNIDVDIEEGKAVDELDDIFIVEWMEDISIEDKESEGAVFDTVVEVSKSQGPSTYITGEVTFNQNVL